MNRFLILLRSKGVINWFVGSIIKVKGILKRRLSRIRRDKRRGGWRRGLKMIF